MNRPWWIPLSIFAAGWLTGLLFVFSLNAMPSHHPSVGTPYAPSTPQVIWTDPPDWNIDLHMMVWCEADHTMVVTVRDPYHHTAAMAVMPDACLQNKPGS